jgi:glycosyltransferase involved in cell wall biosynthesis
MQVAVTDFRLAYCTNIWSHHQAPICRELARRLGPERFTMVLFEPVFEERRAMGWSGDAPGEPWIAGPPKCEADARRLEQIVLDADVAVLGAGSYAVQATRVATGKLTFFMSERMWKKPFAWWRMLNPRYARGVLRFKHLVNRDNVHYLAMGAYAPDDVRRIGAFGNRIWQWAYFPEVATEPPRPRTSPTAGILWVGRMLDWKRVDLLLKAVARICREPGFGRLDVIGSGPERSRLLKLAGRLGLDEKCVFHDSVSADRVRELMRQADVYVMPSNRHEGWGAVVNEAMSEGAVIVANREAGAAAQLIDHGRTGFLFDDNDVAGLADVLKTLLGDAGLRETIRQAAWRSVRDVWSPAVGAERLIGLCAGLLGQSPPPKYSDGPCRRSSVPSGRAITSTHCIAVDSTC